MESIYMNRELSWLKFNARVLEEAESQEVPLCERMTFVSIYQSNLDEFFMVRVGSLQDQMLLDHEIRENKTNMTAQEQIHEILKEVKKLNRRKDQVYTELMKKIEGYGIKLIDFASAKPDEKKFLEAYFNQEIMPLSSPTIVAKRQPFPFLRNEEIYAVVVLETRNKKEKIGIIPCSNNMLPRMIELPGGKGRYMLLEELILHYIGKVFKGYKVKGKSLIRVVRNADIDADALYDEDLDYREFMADLMKQRKKLSPVRLDMSREMDQAVIEALCRYLEITPDRVFKSEAPLDLSFIFQIQDLLRKNSKLFYEKRVPQKSPDFRENESILDQIREEDKLLSYPYESIRPFLKMLTEAAEDESVISIKMTLYRLAKQSKVVEALCEAAENGKEVVVLVELRARFDEENNIVWAKKLEKAGCHVIYGLVGLKTHSKITLVVRREETGIRRYVHLATGNYNDSTAKLYTDCGIFTCDERFGEDATAVFNMLSGYSEPKSWNKLIVAPIWMKDRFLSLIEREAENAKKGLPALIRAKMNSLCDPKIIAGLYYASSCGVQVELLVRGICCLKVGVPGISENIHVRSIVGEFLEHSRIFYFENGGNPEIYMGSADWMPRNLDRRVEIVFPVEDEKIKKELEHVLDLEFKDNVKAHILQPDGTYVKPDKRGKAQINSQMEFCIEATEKAALHKHEEKKSRVFIPAEPAEDIEE